MPPAILDRAAAAFDWLWDGRAPSDPMLGDACLDLWPPGLADPRLFPPWRLLMRSYGVERRLLAPLVEWNAR